LISLKEKLSSLSIKSFPQGLLNNKYIVVMGGSIQRSIYKDLISLGLVEAFSASREPWGVLWIYHYVPDGPLLLGVSQ
jgi:hypothetical protein